MFRMSILCLQSWHTTCPSMKLESITPFFSPRLPRRHIITTRKEVRRNDYMWIVVSLQTLEKTRTARFWIMRSFQKVPAWGLQGLVCLLEAVSYALASWDCPCKLYYGAIKWRLFETLLLNSYSSTRDNLFFLRFMGGTIKHLLGQDF